MKFAGAFLFVSGLVASSHAEKTVESDEAGADTLANLSPEFYQAVLGKDGDSIADRWLKEPEDITKKFNTGRRELSQVISNGLSKLGTLEAKHLPHFLTNNPLPNGYPWSTRNEYTNFYNEYPRTGVIRSYDFTISRGLISPDGYQRPVILVNGAFPGPLIECNWGDTIQVTVHNNITEMTVHNNITEMPEGTALHWHGFFQHGTPWEDGVPGISQCPIPPGKSFTYQFDAQIYGTTWYHSHYSAQWAAGLFGPLIIHGPEHRKYDIDVGPILLTDWYHKDYFNIVEETLEENSPGPVLSDNNLINGKGNFNCSSLSANDTTPCRSNAGLAKFRFQRGKVHRLRLINAGAEGLQRFSIDGHKMTVIANDIVPVEPFETEVVTLGIGQRTDVLVEANGELDSYWMRSNMSESCSLTTQPYALAIIYYENDGEESGSDHGNGSKDNDSGDAKDPTDNEPEDEDSDAGKDTDKNDSENDENYEGKSDSESREDGEDEGNDQVGVYKRKTPSGTTAGRTPSRTAGNSPSNRVPSSTPWNVPDPGTCLNDNLNLTVPVMKLKLPKADLTLEVTVNSTVNASQVTVWTMNDIDFRTNYNSPTLLLSNLGNFSYEKQWHVVNTKNAKSVRVIVNNESNVSHPMHLHGYNMYTLDAGEGRWNGTIVRPSNPNRRDVANMPRKGYLVMQFDAAANPGLWPFHCHIAWHSSAGLLMQFLTNPKEVVKYRIPHVIAETCRQWGTWTKTNVPDMIDSGL
ncbi:hypothetical protein CDD83_11114 [Cordyceps sp. RAO-2017]|nr:hypothetical protein CDD83_11114 [Cordyceps sp. RAO-2017]